MAEKNILFINDPMQWTYEFRKLVVEGYQTFFASSLNEAEELLARNAYACVVIEPFAPEYILDKRKNPLAELIRELNHRAVVVVASTEPKETFDKRYGLELGRNYNCFMPKPIDPDVFVLTIESLVD